MIEFEKRLVTASASQNLDTRNDRVVHRFVPMLVAENLTRIAEYRVGKPLSRVDLWNCVGMRMDKAFASQSDYSDRQEFATALLSDKYAILEELGISKTGREVVRDDDDEVQEWLKRKLNQLFVLRSIYVEEVGVNICNKCDYLLCVEGSMGGECSVCKSREFHTEKREVLLVDIPKDRDSLINNKIILPANTKHVRSFFGQLPDRAMISKVREYGLPLDTVGLPGYVLDPRIGIALMPEVVAEKYGLAEITQVQGAVTAAHNIPYTSILASGVHHTYVLIPKMPITSLEDAKRMGVGFIARHIPYLLMTYKGDITPDQFIAARKEYARITQRIDNIMRMLTSRDLHAVNLTSEDRETLSDIAKDFSEYRVRLGQEKLWMFFKSQGRRCVEVMEKNGYYLSSSDAETLEEVIKLFYK